MKTNDYSLPAKKPEKTLKISVNLRSKLSRELKKRGNPRKSKLMDAINQYEQDNGLESTGVTTQILNKLLNGHSNTIKKSQLDRINEVVDALPPAEVRERIELTETMHNALKREVAKRGDFSFRNLHKASQEYQSIQKLPDVGLTEIQAMTIFYGKCKTVDLLQWKRLKQTVMNLPILEKTSERTSERMRVDKFYTKPTIY